MIAAAFIVALLVLCSLSSSTEYSTKKLDISKSQQRTFLDNLDIYQVTHLNHLSKYIKNELKQADIDTNVINGKDSQAKIFEKRNKQVTKLASLRKDAIEKVSAEYHVRWPTPFEVFNLSVHTKYQNSNQNNRNSLELSNLHEIMENYCIRFYNQFKHQLKQSKKSKSLSNNESSQVFEILLKQFRIDATQSTMLVNDLFFKFQSYLYSIHALHVTKEQYLQYWKQKNTWQCKDIDKKNCSKNNDEDGVLMLSDAFFMTNYEYSAFNVLKYDIFQCISAFFEHSRKLEDLPHKYRNRNERMQLIDDLFLWIGIHSNGSYHAPHVHRDSMISGSYYVKIGQKMNDMHDNTVGNFVLHDARGSIWPFGLNLPLQPIEGQLYLFPSWIKHHVEPTIGKNARIAMSFNVPGSWTALTTMEKVVTQGYKQRHAQV